MRIPSEHLRKRLLPERVLDDALPAVRSYAESVAALYHADPEDVEEAAILGAFTAWETFDPEVRVKWQTWLRRNVNWSISEAARDWDKRRRKDVQEFHATYQVFSLNDCVGAESDLTLDEVVADPRGRFEERLLARMEAEELLAHLPPRERSIFQQRYLEDDQKKAVAEALQISPSRVSQLEATGRDRVLAAYAPLKWARRNSVTWDTHDSRGVHWVVRRNSKKRTYSVLRNGRRLHVCRTRPEATQFVEERAANVGTDLASRVRERLARERLPLSVREPAPS